MEAPASERPETAPTQAAAAHDAVAAPPADWPREGPFDDPTKPEKAYVDAAVRTALAAKLGLAAEDDRVFAEAAPGGPASAADDKEAREMLRYLDEESALYAAGVAVDDTERELAAAEAARRKAGAPPSKRPKGLESKAWKGGFFDTKRPAAKKKPFDKMRLLPPAPDAPGVAAAPPAPPPWEELTGPRSAEEAAELEAEMAQLRVLAAAPARTSSTSASSRATPRRRAPRARPRWTRSRRPASRRKKKRWTGASSTCSRRQRRRERARGGSAKSPAASRRARRGRVRRA